jgi:MurNAc alpha-1-phosphate uridylyltransferase
MSRSAKPMSLRPKTTGTPIRTAMVMAAGLGKRMRPLTITRPKPLVEVAGKPLIDHVFGRLIAGGVSRIVVNVHYLADALEAHVRRSYPDMEVLFSDERAELLDTGGGVTRALPLIADDTFLVLASDIFWMDGPIDAVSLLASRWDDEKMDALLLLVPLARAHSHRGTGDFHMDAVGTISRPRSGKVAPFVYASVQIVSRRLFAGAPEGPFSTNLLWDRAIAAGRAFGVVHQGFWSEVGVPSAIAETEALLIGG